MAVVAYGKILPKEILEIPKYAPVNVLFSLLPLYRGAAPVNWAIYNGDEYTGVSTMKMGIGMDDGDILLTERTPIERKNALMIAEELSVTGADLLLKTFDSYDTLTPQVQEHDKATMAPMMSKQDGLIDWRKDAAHIERMIRAFMPWPGVYTHLDGKLLKVFAADVDENASETPGTVYSIGKDHFSVATSQGGLIIKELQLEGKRRMDAAGFLAGYKLQLGNKIG